MDLTTTSRVIAAPPERLWSLLTETRYWPKWGTTIAGVTSSESPIALVTTGQVEIALLGLTLPFTVTEFEPMRFWTWTVAKTPATTHSLKDLGAGRCEVTFGVPSALLSPYLALCQHAIAKLEELA